jgi:hypothetical protein
MVFGASSKYSCAALSTRPRSNFATAVLGLRSISSEEADEEKDRRDAATAAAPNTTNLRRESFNTPTPIVRPKIS